MAIKLRIKTSTIEIDFEGPEEFFKDEFHNLLNTISELRGGESGVDEGEAAGRGEDIGGAAAGGGAIQLTTGNIMAKMGYSTGPELIIAAAAHLTLVQKKDTLGRREILEEMKRATSY